MPLTCPWHHASTLSQWSKLSSQLCQQHSLLISNVPSASTTDKVPTLESIQICWWHLLGRATDTSGFSPRTLVLNNAQLVPSSAGEHWADPVSLQCLQSLWRGCQLAPHPSLRGRDASQTHVPPTPARTPHTEGVPDGSLGPPLQLEHLTQKSVFV